MTIKNNKEFQRYAVVDGTRYSVTRPLNTWDMNFHFITDNGSDYLVDLNDIAEHVGKRGANLDDAITYALDCDGGQFYWTVR